jgi:DNA-binding PadR family transcriptional regulator
MTAVLTTRSALLQVLRDRPGYGLELIRRLETAGIQLAEARVYSVLKELKGQGLVASVRLAPREQRGGRTRIYYRLTSAGARMAERERQLLRGLVTRSVQPPPTKRERLRMAARIIEADELAESGEALRVAGGR